MYIFHAYIGDVNPKLVLEEGATRLEEFDTGNIGHVHSSNSGLI